MVEVWELISAAHNHSRLLRKADLPGHREETIRLEDYLDCHCKHYFLYQKGWEESVFGRLDMDLIHQTSRSCSNSASSVHFGTFKEVELTHIQ